MKIKTAVVGLLLMVGSSVFAQSSLSDMKSSANERFTAEFNVLRTAQTCIGNSKTVEAFKACKYDMYESMKMQKQEAREEKKASM